MNTEPQALIDLIYKHARLHRMALPQLTRLVKLMYLAELEYFRLKRQRLTDLDWKFHRYGPYPPALESVLGDSEIQESEWKSGKSSRQILRDEDQFMEAKGDPDLERIIGRIVKEWGDADLNQLLDYVYFETEPMQNARRGDDLNFSSATGPSKKIQIHLDRERLADLRAQLRERASAYAEVRRPSQPPADLIESLHAWDNDRSQSFPSGPCRIDVDDLVPGE